MDTLDRKLIQLLQKDARQSSEVLAKQLKVSAATVRRRVRKLIQEEILHVVALVDPAKVGYPLCAFMAFDVAHDKLDDVLDALSAEPEVVWASTTTGRFDILALARFASTDELSDFVEKRVIKIDGVNNSETSICLRINKGRYTQI